MPEGYSGLISTPIVVAIVVVLILFVISVCVVSMWKRVPQDKALVVTGMKKRVISGGGGLVIPLLERTDLISLENMQIPVKIEGLTYKGVSIRVEALTVLKIKNEQTSILAAMEQFNTGKLDGTIRNIKETSTEVLEGKLREIISKMTVEEIYQDREKFAIQVQDVAAKELEDMGLEIKAFTVKDISDDQGYLISLGKAQIAEVKKNASIAESIATKEQQITIAENDRETAIKTAELRKDTAIKLAINEQEKQEAQASADIKIAEAQREKELKNLSNAEATQRKKAQTDVAYEVEQNIRQKEIIEAKMQAQVLQEEKNIDLTKAMMEVQRTQEEQETVVAKQKALRVEEELNSEIQKKAEADATKIKIMAEADLFKRTKEAEARKLEEVKKAEAEAEKRKLNANADAIALKETSIAEAEATKAKGFASADSTRANGLADAESVRALGLAEAEVIREKALAEAQAMLKKAEAYERYGEAARMEMLINIMPQVTKAMSDAVVASVAQIGNISIIDSGGGNGANSITGLTTKMLTEIPAAIKATTGIDLTAMAKNWTDIKTQESAVKAKAVPEILQMDADAISKLIPNPLTQQIVKAKLGGLTLNEYIKQNGAKELLPVIDSLRSQADTALVKILDELELHCRAAE